MIAALALRHSAASPAATPVIGEDEWQRHVVGDVHRSHSGGETGPLCMTDWSPRLFVRRCTPKYSNEAITFPKLNVVLARHSFGSTSRRLPVNAVELRRKPHAGCCPPRTLCSA